MKYADARAFEQALSDRLKRQASEEGVDLDRLRKWVAFDRYDTHALPNPLPAPPGNWTEPFGAEARNLGLTTTNIDHAHDVLEDYLRTLTDR